MLIKLHKSRTCMEKKAFHDYQLYYIIEVTDNKIYEYCNACGYNFQRVKGIGEKTMRVDDLEGLRNWLSRIGDLDSMNSDLLENAIWCIKNGSEYRAECSLRTLASNLRNVGKSESAKAVERLLQ